MRLVTRDDYEIQDAGSGYGRVIFLPTRECIHTPEKLAYPTHQRDYDIASKNDPNMGFWWEGLYNEDWTPKTA